MTPHALLRRKLEQLLAGWQAQGMPGRHSLHAQSDALSAWKAANPGASLWAETRRMATATLDDGWGHGLQTIEMYAALAGLEIHALGLEQPPERIIAACRRLRPQILGLTVLQFDSEDTLAMICRSLPPETLTVVGGPIFRADPELAERAGVDYVARHVGDFLQFLLAW
jgi:methylmalonyl-CoA mutase cobalamin-binding subunit